MMKSPMSAMMGVLAAAANLPRRAGQMLGIVNDDPQKGPRRLRTVHPFSAPKVHDHQRENQRRLKQIAYGRVPFSQLRGDPFVTYREAISRVMVGKAA